MVFADRPPRREAELVPSELAAARIGNFTAGRGIALIHSEKVAGVQLVIAEEFVRRAMILVGAGFRHEIND